MYTTAFELISGSENYAQRAPPEQKVRRHARQESNNARLVRAPPRDLPPSPRGLRVSGDLNKPVGDDDERSDGLKTTRGRSGPFTITRAGRQSAGRRARAVSAASRRPAAAAAYQSSGVTTRANTPQSLSPAPSRPSASRRPTNVRRHHAPTAFFRRCAGTVTVDFRPRTRPVRPSPG